MKAPGSPRQDEGAATDRRSRPMCPSIFQGWMEQRQARCPPIIMPSPITAAAGWLLRSASRLQGIEGRRHGAGPAPEQGQAEMDNTPRWPWVTGKKVPSWPVRPPPPRTDRGAWYPAAPSRPRSSPGR